MTRIDVDGRVVERLLDQIADSIASRRRGGHEGDANPEERMDQVYVGGDWDADAEENEATSRDDRYN